VRRRGAGGDDAPAGADAGREVPAEHIADVCGYLDRAECVELCRRLGIARTVRTRREAVAAAGRWVNTVPHARQAIAY
jgi:hypothetical protein